MFQGSLQSEKRSDAVMTSETELHDAILPSINIHASCKPQQEWVLSMYKKFIHCPTQDFLSHRERIINQ